MAAEEHGIKIPDDIAIFGNDDLEFSKILVPKLTTTFQPKRSIFRSQEDRDETGYHYQAISKTHPIRSAAGNNNI